MGLGQIGHDFAGLVDVGGVADVHGDGAGRVLAGKGSVDAGLAGDKAVGNHDFAVVVGSYGGVAEAEAFDDAGFDAGGSGDLETIVEAEGAVEQQRKAGDEIAQRALRGKADDDRNQADAGQQNFADFFKQRNVVDVEEQGDDVNHQAGKVADKFQGGG